jgi:hypothetical protein
MGDGQQERECLEYLKCPACQDIDQDFELVDNRSSGISAAERPFTLRDTKCTSSLLAN